MSAPTRRTLTVAVSVGLLTACGEPKEAADPHDLIADETAQYDLGAAGADAVAAPPGRAAPHQADPPASAAECKAAARHVVELGLRAAAGPTSHRTATITDVERRKLVQEAADECLRWSTPRSEARCVAEAKQEADLEACTQ